MVDLVRETVAERSKADASPLSDEVSRSFGNLASNERYIAAPNTTLPNFAIETNLASDRQNLVHLAAARSDAQVAEAEEHTMSARVFGWGWTFDIKDKNGQSEGMVDEKMLRWTKTFAYSDANGNVKAIGKVNPFSWGKQIDVTDENGKDIGGIQEKVFQSFFHPYTVYSIVDAQDKEIAKSEKVEVFSTDFTLKNEKGETIATIHRPPINLVRDNWSINIIKPGEVDKRILYMIPAYKTSADYDKAQAEEEQRNKQENEEDN